MSAIQSNTNAPIDFSRSAVSRYLQLASLFRNRVESGEWPLDKQIPTVDELAAACNVARATVRQALDVLEDEKLIARFRAKGTFVIAKPQDQLWCEVATDWSGQLLSPEGATIEVLQERNRQPAPQMDIAGGKLTEFYQHWRRRHWRNGKPYYFGDVYIDEKIGKKISDKTFETKTSMRILRDLPGLEIAEAHQTLTLGSADPTIADILKIPLNSAIAYVSRKAIDQKGHVVFYGKGIYRGDVIRLNIKLK